MGGSYRDQDWESAGGGCKTPRTSNVRADLRLQGTLKITEHGLRYCANKRSIAFVDCSWTTTQE